MRVVVMMIGLFMSLNAGPSVASDPSRQLEADVEAVVRELLEREPELVVDAIRAYQAKEEAARAAATQAAIQASRAQMLAADHPSVGPADAAVTLVEFFDYRCGFCRRMLPALEALKDNNTDMRVVYIDFPVLGPDSLRAAQASVAAWMQAPESYAAFHVGLMSAEDLSSTAIATLADQHGLDADRLLDEMRSASVRDRLEANYALAQAIGIEGTPAFVVGDTFLPGAVPMEQLEAAVNAARGS